MKTLITFLCILLLILLSACNDKVEESFIENETDLYIAIPITSETNSNLVKSVADHAFSGTNEFNISNMVRQEINVSNIYDIKLRNGSYISFSDVPEEQGVSCLVFDWNYDSFINPSSNLQESFDLLSLDYTVNNGECQINIDNELARLINGIDDNTGLIKIVVSGTCCNELNCIASLHIPVTVISKFYSPRIDISF